MDEQLSQLAATDPSRLHRLNQRMQSAAVPEPVRRPALVSVTSAPSLSAAGNAALLAARVALQQPRPPRTQGAPASFTAALLIQAARRCRPRWQSGATPI